MVSLVHRTKHTFVACAVTCVLGAACSGSQTPPSESAPAPPSAGSNEPIQRPELTADACQATGGTVVGDIGDGAIHRADYSCPSGKKPSGNIRAPEGGPIAVEGSVCCPK